MFLAPAAEESQRAIDKSTVCARHLLCLCSQGRYLSTLRFQILRISNRLNSVMTMCHGQATGILPASEVEKW